LTFIPLAVLSRPQKNEWYNFNLYRPDLIMSQNLLMTLPQNRTVQAVTRAAKLETLYLAGFTREEWETIGQQFVSRSADYSHSSRFPGCFELKRPTLHLRAMTCDKKLDVGNLLRILRTDHDRFSGIPNAFEHEEEDKQLYAQIKFSLSRAPKEAEVIYRRLLETAKQKFYREKWYPDSWIAIEPAPRG
jgi:hypothetical protein